MNMNILLSRIVGSLLILFGIGLALGGAYLVSLGGSFFYLVAGIAMAIIGLGVIKKRSYAFWISIGLLIFATLWALWEVGTDFWQLVPRIITFLVIAIVLSIFAPILHSKDNQPTLSKKISWSLAGLFTLVFFGFIAAMFKPHPTVEAKENSTPSINPTAGDSQGGDWSAWGRNNSGDRFAQFTQINKDNVKDLKVAWTYRTGDLAVNGAEYQVTPIKVDNSMYLCTPHNEVISLDPISGQENWRFDPQLRETSGNAHWKRCRGVSYADLSELSGTEHVAKDQVCSTRIVSTTNDGRLFTVDAKTGKQCDDFGTQGFVNLLDGLGASAEGSYYLTSAPLVANGVVLVGGKLNDNLTVGEASGVVRGYDVRTGKLLWAWDAARGKTDSKPLAPGETYKVETPNFWGTAAYDPALGLAYFPTGNQTPDFWTGNRHQYSNEYNDSVVAVDIKTGQERWHFRTANIDAFDYDVSSQPILYDIPQKDGSKVPALIQLTKRGQVFVLDRRDGKPVFPVEQRAVSTDAMPGMQIAPTQPYSAISVGTDRLKEQDMWGATIFDQLICRIQFKDMRWEGEFTPLSDKKRTLIYPGYYGGFNWGGGALDASTGTLIVNDIRMAQWGKFINREEAKRIGLKPSTEGEYSEQLGTPWGVERSMFVSPLGVPCFKPPFGTMTAIDLTNGQTKWQVPMGTIEDAPIQGIKPGVHMPIGMPTMGGPLVTKGDLTFFHGSLDNYLRALDSNTGKELWRSRLPVGGQGAPMTYIGKDGKQYVVVVAGGATRTGSNENRGDYVIAYTLP